MNRMALHLLLATLLFGSLSVCNSDAKSADRRPLLPRVAWQHHPIETSNVKAQAYFDQGLSLYYAFEDEEARRAFREAARLDPASPMPHWGIALVEVPRCNIDIDEGREKPSHEAIKEAVKAAENAPQLEKDYVLALSKRYSGEADPVCGKLARDYAVAMRDLSEKYPDDLDAATLYAISLTNLSSEKLWTADGKPGQYTREIVGVLESVLRREPAHLGANHYYIHVFETSPNPERALPSAHRLESLALSAGHLLHLPAHIYFRSGDYDGARKSALNAASHDKALVTRVVKPGSYYDLVYRSHNERLLIAAAAMEGRYEEAKGFADALAARLGPRASGMPLLQEFLATPLFVDARFGKWDALFGQPEPAKKLSTTHALWHFTRALAFTATGDVPRATTERDAMKNEVAAMPAKAMFNDLDTAEDVFAVAGNIMEARIAAQLGRKDEAVSHWREAVDTQDDFRSVDPLGWLGSLRESLGAAWLASGNLVEAEKAFREDLRRTPRNPRSLFGLAECMKAQKREADAALLLLQFQEAWRYADTPLKASDH